MAGAVPIRAMGASAAARSKQMPFSRLPASVVQVAMALILALVAAPVVRTITSELSQSVGRTWPFSMEHCVQADPECRPAGPGLPGPQSPLHSLAVR